MYKRRTSRIIESGGLSAALSPEKKCKPRVDVAMDVAVACGSLLWALGSGVWGWVGHGDVHNCYCFLLLETNANWRLALVFSTRPILHSPLTGPMLVLVELEFLLRAPLALIFNPSGFFQLVVSYL